MCNGHILFKSSICFAVLVVGLLSTSVLRMDAMFPGVWFPSLSLLMLGVMELDKLKLGSFLAFASLLTN